MKQKEIIYADDSPQMLEVYKKAQETFKYFWRESWWDNRRIIPALEVAYVKAAFTQDKSPKPPIVEFMWIGDIEFDGITIQGTLINKPHKIRNIKRGATVKIPLDEVKDWLFSIAGKTYGGYTIQVMRSLMNDKERSAHDRAWGLDFGDFDNILVAYDQEKHPEYLIEHPMNTNMQDSLKTYLTANPDEITKKDEFGYTMLHREVIAGNKVCVAVLLEMGADMDAKTNSGYTAGDFAKILNWEHLIPLL